MRRMRQRGKCRRRAALAVLVAALSAGLPCTAFAAGPGEGSGEAWEYSGGAYRLADGTAIENVFARGIDVSRWQGDIDWNQVAADDVSFVMLGTRSKGAVDPYFHKNIQEAHAAGVKVGVYIYSLATTTDMAVQEADFVLNLIKDYPVSYPVAFDMEDSTQGTLSKEQLAQIANAFCGRIKEAGYYPIIYANENWLKNKLDMSLMDYPVWVARYGAMYTYANPVMWQATNTGSVNGIAGNVDIDFQFQDFSGVIPSDLWRTIGGNTYYYKDYAMQKDAWIDDGDGWYYMDSDGLAKKGWFEQSGQVYFLDETTGRMQYGWKDRDGKWYYLGSSGAAETGWIQAGNAWYYADSAGVMQTGWLEDNGNHYYLKPSGAMATGWLEDGGNWYYLGGSGAMDKGWVHVNSAWYYLGEDGVMRTGWLEDGASRYFLEPDGHMATGWTNQDGKWYYMDPASGAMQTGWISADNTRYYADAEGVMQTGWLTDGGYTYYLKGDGSMGTGWREMNGAWYYFNSEGHMVTNWEAVNGQWYFFDGNGVMQTGLVDVNGVKYYLDPADGHMLSNTAVTVDGVSYTADGSGALTQVLETAPETQAPAGGDEGAAQESAQLVPPAGQPVTGVNGGPGIGM